MYTPAARGQKMHVSQPDKQVSLEAQELKASHSPSKCSDTAKEMLSEWERQPTEWKKISANSKSDKELISKVYKELNSIAKKHIVKFKTGCWT